MGRRTTRVRRKGPQRPSMFFIVALAVGVAIVALIAIAFIRTPMKPANAPARTTSSLSYGTFTYS